MKKALSLLLALLLTGMLAACGNDASNDSVLEAAPSESQKEETTTSETEPPAAELISIEPKFDLDAGTVTLNNGVSMPILGIGTFALSDSEAEESVYWALQDGYRLIDTARIYGDEAGVGRAIRRAIDEGFVTREEIFVTTKNVDKRLR